MSRVQRLKAFFKKENYDYSEGEVNPYEFHKTFYYLCKFFRVIDNEPVLMWTFPVIIVFLLNAIVAAFMCFISLIKYISIFDIPLITEAGTYFIIMIYKAIIIICSFTQRHNYRFLMQALRDDFEYICTRGSRYREKFFKNHLWTWKVSILVSSFSFGIGGGMTFFGHLALFYFFLNPKEGSVRPLPFPYWAGNVDFGKTPNYEIAFVFSMSCIFTHTITYTFMMQTQIVWIRQIMSKADVIIWSIQDLLIDITPTSNKKQIKFYEKVIEARMREIIKMHHSMYSLLKDYAGVYTKILMFEQKVCSPVVCLTAYCAVEKLDAGEFPGIMILMCIATITLIYIPSYMCTALREKVQSIGYACWETPFWNAPGKSVRPYFVLIMQRSLRPLPIQARGFDEVSLETFSNKMKFAYTGFNMLRQATTE